MTSAMRRVAAVCVTTAVAASLVSCADEADERVVGKRWQVTEIYDDPGLPRSAPEGTVPPTVVFGRESYTGDGACGEFRGSLTWRDDDIVAVSEPETVRAAECSPAARVFDDRLRAQLAGEFIVGAPDPELRMTAVGDHPPGEAAPGWSAVTTG
ncbi:hypothetical protein [uncultured Corynebacterium sp.]|uniref:hypothetical protein n=1 Tax=uncultured Corynebacterium sp. TaxID=159447 RepID=UPI0025E0A541|nr:hypothetical protein [uncultured Corynebacterium sp.]